MSRSRIAILVTLVLATAGICSCDSADRAQAAGRGETTPLATAQRFVAAVNAKDTAALEETLTEKAREGLRSGSGANLTGKALTDVKWGSPVVEGQAARVPFRATRDGESHDATLHLRRERGEWRIRALEVAIPGAESMTIDLESAGALAGELATAFAEGIAGSLAGGGASQGSSGGDAGSAAAKRLGEEMARGLERAFADALREGEARELARRRAAFAALKALPRDRFEASWRLDRDLRGTSAAAAVETLAAELGLSVDLGGERTRFAAPVSRDVRGQSRTAAIESIAADLGCRPLFPPLHELEALGDGALARALGTSGITGSAGGAEAAALAAGRSAAMPGAIRFEAGPPTAPFVHAGPFRISIDSVDQDPRYGTGSVEVVMRAYGLDPALAAAVAAVDESVSFEAVRDEQGRDLRVEPDVRYIGGGNLIRGACEERTSIELKGLVRDVPRIARIAGTQRLVLPASIVEIELSPLAAGTTGKAGKLRYTVREAGPATTVVIAGPEGMMQSLMVVGRAVDSSGMELAVHHEGTSTWTGGEAHYQIHCATAPARLDLKCVTSSELVEFPFAIDDVALPRAHEALAEIPRLSFAGHGAPVEARFVELRGAEEDFPKVLLSLSNHSNKDVARITARFEYLNAAGGILEDFPHTLSAPASFDGRDPLLEARKACQHEATAFFLPKGTATVRVTVDAVEFMDAQKWVRDEGR